MKEHIAALIADALQHLQQQGVWPDDLQAEVQVERTRDKQHGDLASNVAMTLARPLKAPPRRIAEQLIAVLPESPDVERVEIAGPGFINFFLRVGAERRVLSEILEQGEQYGRRPPGSADSVQVEFVSANPTGPLHVGHGRGAAYGASLASLLEATGHRVQREYYVNDAGRQMDILAASVWLRYLQACGEDIRFPENGYQGDYVVRYAGELREEHGDALARPAATVLEGVPADAAEGGDKETHIDALIERARALLGGDYETVFARGLERTLDEIRQDLSEFNVEFDRWYSERSLTGEPDRVARAIERLRDNGYVEERDGALWFLATHFGDDKDRVLRRDNGATTYFASDVAYHLDKFDRGFDRVINVWGADHHGYVARVKAALEALGIEPRRLIVQLVQFVSLYRGGEQVQMSTRSGSFVTLRELREEVGSDAARFFYITRKAEQPTDFDLDLAKSESKDNPVYYIQYAHARVCSVLRKLDERGERWTLEEALPSLERLDQEAESDLMARLAQYPEVLAHAAAGFDPHLLAHYLRELAGEFHAYYNAHKVLCDDASLRMARLTLSLAVRQVVNNGLTLLGVSAPEEM